MRRTLTYPTGRLSPSTANTTFGAPRSSDAISRSRSSAISAVASARTPNARDISPPAVSSGYCSSGMTSSASLIPASAASA